MVYFLGKNIIFDYPHDTQYFQVFFSNLSSTDSFQLGPHIHALEDDAFLSGNICAINIDEIISHKQQQIPSATCPLIVMRTCTDRYWIISLQNVWLLSRESPSPPEKQTEPIHPLGIKQDLQTDSNVGKSHTKTYHWHFYHGVFINWFLAKLKIFYTLCEKIN